MTQMSFSQAVTTLLDIAGMPTGKTERCAFTNPQENSQFIKRVLLAASHSQYVQLVGQLTQILEQNGINCNTNENW